MTDVIGRPLLFLDVDGPLIPFGVRPGREPAGQAGFDPPEPATNPLLARLDPDHGRRLSALPCDLVWATTWMEDANDEIAPRLGLPQLPVLVWPDSAEDDEYDRGLHWKTRGLVEWAAGRSFVWVDDEITDADRAWVSANHRGRALLHYVDHRLGLTGEDFDVMGRWLAAHR
ncbi:HAD domain-containing protein [Actinoallomurus sp. NPDC052308]|uniref:HAD domain-containing protein n=1 Tax=Actinoallomurus sp. NPDC052308 TaxID=3155530 RepID=UPI0034149708